MGLKFSKYKLQNHMNIWDSGSGKKKGDIKPQDIH